MLSGINIAIFILWLLSALADYGQFCYLWQLKEYRLDRFKDFLRSEQGKRFFIQYPLFWRSLIALVMFFWPINETGFLKEIIIAVYAFDVLNALKRFAEKSIHRPRITYKSALIIGLSLLLEGAWLLFTRDWAVLFLLLILRFVILSVLVGLFSFPTRAIKHLRIRAAKKKLATYSHLKVIGITGSYGKSSTKEFLYHFLSEKYRVIKTPKNINTEIGVAQFILKTDFSSVDYFIVEMGAYTVGEIALICDMVRPTYGILTTIAEEHLALFGSIENIQKAKYELLHALPKEGFAVTNGDNPYCTARLHQILPPHAVFGFDHGAQGQVLEVGQNPEGITCDMSLNGTRVHLSAPVLGEHNALNIAAAALMALHLGVLHNEIVARAASLHAEHGIIKVYQYGSATIIDDTYNSNPAGFRAALNVLGSYPSSRKRVVITRGMLELGSLSDERHEEVGGEISFIADELVIISPDAADAIERGMVKKYGTTVYRIFDSSELRTFIQSKKQTDAVILLENRMPAAVVDELTHNNT